MGLLARSAPALSRSFSATRRRRLPPSVIVTEQAAERMRALLLTNPKAVGVRMGMVNDWGSHTGFSYTLSFVEEGGVAADDERIDLPSDVAFFVDRKALWAGEGGLLGATIDMDESFALKVIPKDEADAKR